MKRPRRQTEKQRREHIETLALLARLVVLVPHSFVRRLFFVLSV